MYSEWLHNIKHISDDEYDNMTSSEQEALFLEFLASDYANLLRVVN